MIKSVSDNEQEIIRWIIDLHIKSETFDADPTFGRGKFYSKDIKAPKFISDLNPRYDFVVESCATSLPIESCSIASLMFDPPFVAGHTKKPTGIIGKKYHGFPYMRDVWAFYDEAIKEHYRVLNFGGIYVFKCQDSCSSDRNWISHARVIALAEKVGFYVKDLFILTAKNRLVGHNHKNAQKHARKFHSYFIVFEKIDGVNRQASTIFSS